MRNPNGYGTVAKLSGTRRNPFIVKKVTGWKDNGQPIYSIIGYTATREEGNILLAQYNNNPWDVDKAKITLDKLFDLWKEKKAPKLGKSNRSLLCSAFKHCKTLSKLPYRNIKAFHMQDTIDNCGKSYATQAAIKSLWGHLDRFALEIDIISKCYSDLLSSDPVPETSKIPFTDEEVQCLWDHQNEPWVDSILVFLYSGWRISELLEIKPSDVDLTLGIMKGGTKTKAGKDRIVPIHSKIRPLIEKRISENSPYLFSYNGNRCTNSTYYNIWNEIMKRLNMRHTPHECRHTFRTRLDAAGANHRCMDLLMGHVSKSTGDRVYNHKTIEDLKNAIELITN